MTFFLSVHFSKMSTEDKPEPKPGSLESWDKYMGVSKSSWDNSYRRFLNTILNGPARWFRENIVEPNQGPEYPYYHRRYRRVPTIDECYTHDYACQ